MMWTFAYGEKETQQMANSMLFCGRQARNLLKQINELSRHEFGVKLKTKAVALILTFKLFTTAKHSKGFPMAVEVRVIREVGGGIALELYQEGVWRRIPATAGK